MGNLLSCVRDTRSEAKPKAGGHGGDKGLSEAQTTFGFSRDFDKDFRLGKILGRGSFGTVYTVIPTIKSKYAGRNDLAVKVINKITFKNEKEVFWLKQEIKIMKTLSNSLNIVNLYDTYENSGRVFILMEKCSGGTLYDRILKGKTYSESTARVVFGDILRTVEQCHLRGVLHRDIKPENFLFASNEKTAPLKATDFGLACFCKPTDVITDVTGTPYFIAPEVIQRKYNMGADLWSCGVVLYFLLTGETPFAALPGEKNSYKDVFRRILTNPITLKGKPWDSISDQAKDLLLKLLERDPSKRLTAQQALAHPWIAKDGVAPSRGLGDSLIQRLQMYGSYNRLKKLVMIRLLKHLKDADVSELSTIFSKIDTDMDGQVTTKEMLTGLKKQGYFLSERDVERLLYHSDVNESGTLDKEEFISALLDIDALVEHWPRIIKKTFQDFDTDGDGKITLKELAEATKGQIDEDELATCIGEADKDGDGTIDLQEFEALVRSQANLDIYDKRTGERFDKMEGPAPSDFRRVMREADDIGDLSF